MNNVINSVSEPISVCLVERNISVLANFSVPFQDVLRFLKNKLLLLLLLLLLLYIEREKERERERERDEFKLHLV